MGQICLYDMCDNRVTIANSKLAVQLGLKESRMNHPYGSKIGAQSMQDHKSRRLQDRRRS